VFVCFSPALFGQTAFVAAGDSITDAVGRCDVTISSQRWYNQANSLSWFSPRSGTWYQSASSGWQISNLVSDYSFSVAPHKPNGTTVINAYLFVYIGTNDLGIGGASAATVRTNLHTYWGMGRADGFKIVAFTVRSNQEDYADGSDTQRQTLNSYIRSDSAYWDWLADIDADSTLGTATTSSSVWNSTITCDGTHLTVAGLRDFAQVVNSAMAAIYSGVSRFGSIAISGPVAMQ